MACVCRERRFIAEWCDSLMVQVAALGTNVKLLQNKFGSVQHCRLTLIGRTGVMKENGKKEGGRKARRTKEECGFDGTAA